MYSFTYILFLQTSIVLCRYKVKEIEEEFFPMMRTLRIYTLNQFHIQYTTVLIMLIMLYITSLGLIYLITARLYL